jgi:hypothetical protein
MCMKKTVTYRIQCAGRVTLGKSCTPPNNVLLELSDVYFELGMPDRRTDWEESTKLRNWYRVW